MSTTELDKFADLANCIGQHTFSTVRYMDTHILTTAWPKLKS